LLPARPAGSGKVRVAGGRAGVIHNSRYDETRKGKRMKIIKGAAIAAIIVSVILAACSGARASDYQGDESRQSIFQKLGDLITGNYRVDGKPLDKVGVFNVFADQAKAIGPSTEKIESSWNPTEPPKTDARK
jgi:hypothetical protein